MMKSKKVIASLCAILLMTLSNSFTYANNKSETELTVADIAKATLSESDLVAANPDYISFSDYLEKYGEANTVRGFNLSSVASQSDFRGTVDVSVLKRYSPMAFDTDSTTFNEPNDLFEQLSEGKFLGLDVLGVSDLPPNDTRFSIHVRKPDDFIEAPYIGEMDRSRTNATSSTILSMSSNDHYAEYTDAVTGTDYGLFWYGNNKPASSYLSTYLCKPTHGAFMYKYSWYNDDSYACSTEVTFNNTKLKEGNESLNMYVYVAAQGAGPTLDFGLMANPTVHDGMYGFCSDGTTEGWFIDSNPKVTKKSYNPNTKTLTLNNKTIKILHVVNTSSCDLFMYIPGSNSPIFYHNVSVSGISKDAASLTFIQAMSCVHPPSSVTSLTSGGYFGTINFANSTLYRLSSDGGDVDFPPCSSNTYFTYVNYPDYINVNDNYNSNHETVTIDYS